METKFQTSFIPKKPIASIPNQALGAHHAGASLFMIFAVILFIASLGGIGGVYAWKQILLKQQASQKQELVDREKQFNVDLIEHLKQVNIKIDLGKQILARHLAVSQIFGIISQMTIESVRFMSMTLSAPVDPGKDIELTMSGYGANLPSVAFQSDVLSQLERYGLRKIVKNPILANPNLDPTGSTVSFNFTASIDPTALSYEKAVNGESSNTGSTP